MSDYSYILTLITLVFMIGVAVWLCVMATLSLFSNRNRYSADCSDDYQAWVDYQNALQRYEQIQWHQTQKQNKPVKLLTNNRGNANMATVGIVFGIAVIASLFVAIAIETGFSISPIFGLIRSIVELFVVGGILMIALSVVGILAYIVKPYIRH